MSPYRRVSLLTVAAITATVIASGAPAASAQGPVPETITSEFFAASFPATPPYRATYPGVFTASGTVNDSGTISADALFSAFSSPLTIVLQTVRTLTGSDGSTLTLRCTQMSHGPADPSAIPDQGSCAVLTATGPYAALSGAGALVGVANLTVSPMTLTDTLTLGTP